MKAMEDMQHGSDRDLNDRSSRQKERAKKLFLCKQEELW